MMRPVVIVTRPQADSERLARRLEQIGCRCVLAPLITIEPVVANDLPQDDLQAVVFTSANGVSGLMAQANAERFLEFPAVAVGPASMRAARDAGFTDAVQSGGDVVAVIETVRSRFKPDGGAIFYPSGKHLAGDLCGELAAFGFSVVRSVVYGAEHCGKMPEPAATVLASGDRVAVCLYSPRSARIWCDNLSDLTDDNQQVANVDYFCLSDNVAAVLRNQLGDAAVVYIADSADDAGMIELVKKHLVNRG